MASFPKVFAENGPKRQPTNVEYDQGFPCGAADLPLFNYLFNVLMSAINGLGSSGVIPDAHIAVTGTQNAPPSSPAAGSRYLVGTSPTGAWTGFANNIAAYVDGAWTFLAPRTAMLVSYFANGRMYVLDYTGTAWAEFVADTNAPGLVELATSAETITGADALRAITPAGLASLTSTDARRGLVELATIAEALAGTDSVRAVTPAGLKSAIDNIRQKANTVVAFAEAGSYTWTVPADVYRVNVEVWGGGGGGGGAYNTSSGGSGGSGGGYAMGSYTVTPGQQINVRVGAGGTPGPASSTSQAGDGGSSAFGTLISADGGIGGTPANGNFPPARDGGIGRNGDVNLRGRGGGVGFVTGSQSSGGFGGSAYGSSIAGPNVGSAGHDGSIPGGGGSGASAQAAGGRGAVGLVKITF